MKKSLPLVTVFAMALLAAPCPAAEINHATTLNDQLQSSPSANDLSQPQFATAIDDLPLMPGLNLVQSNDVVFSSGQDRIAATDAIGAVDVDDVYHFYRRTLPQLGWKYITMRRYHRNNEVLSIDAHADGKTTSVHFAVHPVEGK